MDYKKYAVATAALALAACGQQQQKSETNAIAPGAAQPTEAAQTYSGTGEVTAIANDQVSIAHGPIQRISWPAMTMTFTAPADMATNVTVGSHVIFAFRKQDNAYVLTALQKRG